MTQYAYNPYLNINLGHHYRYLLPSLSKILPSPKKLIKILDLGCGNGSFTNYLNKQGFDATGLDPSESGIALAKQRFSDVQFIQGNLYNFPFQRAHATVSGTYCRRGGEAESWNPGVSSCRKMTCFRALPKHEMRPLSTSSL